ncbi:hypothetical protein PIB30_044279, partial [Stylosanthes scabra]|nr:hypothetical protein [Stylosanthes scabra]
MMNMMKRLSSPCWSSLLLRNRKDNKINCQFLFSTTTIAPSSEVEQEEENVGAKMPHFNHTPSPYSGPSASDLSKRRKLYLPTAVGPYYTNPLNLVEGKMQYLYDENGRRYLDAFGGIAT